MVAAREKSKGRISIWGLCPVGFRKPFRLKLICHNACKAF
jgi:hypothetical protein